MVSFEVLFGNIPVQLAAPSNPIIVLSNIKKSKSFKIKIINRLQSNVSKKSEYHTSNLKILFKTKMEDDNPRQFDQV